MSGKKGSPPIGLCLVYQCRRIPQSVAWALPIHVRSPFDAGSRTHLRAPNNAPPWKEGSAKTVCTRRIWIRGELSHMPTSLTTANVTRRYVMGGLCPQTGSLMNRAAPACHNTEDPQRSTQATRRYDLRHVRSPSKSLIHSCKLSTTHVQPFKCVLKFNRQCGCSHMHMRGGTPEGSAFSRGLCCMLISHGFGRD